MRNFNWKYFIPLALLLLAPWTHWVLYHNLLLAWPNLNPSDAHYGVIISTGIVAFISAMILGGM